MTSELINFNVDIWIPFLLLVGMTLFFRAVAPCWLYPGPFFSLYWTATIGVSLPFNRFPLWSGTLWWLVATIFAFCIGSFIGGTAKAGYPVKGLGVSSGHYHYPWLERFIVFCFILGMLRVYFLGRVVADPMADQPPVWLQFGLVAIYLGDMLGGVLLGSTKTFRGMIIAFLGLLPQIAYSLIYGGRSSLVLGVFFFAGGYYGIKIFISGGKVHFLTAKLITGTVSLIMALFFLGILMGVFRFDPKEYEGGREKLTRFISNVEKKILDKSEFIGIADRFLPVIFGNIYSFSYFFKPVWEDPSPKYYVTVSVNEPHLSEYWDKPRPLEYGRLTFRGILRVVGIEPALIKQYPSFPVMNGVHSNVYTSFMPPILDFGLPGSLVFSFVFGLLMGFSYLKLAQGHLGFIAAFCFFFPHVLNSGGLFFPYNSINLALVLIALPVLWARNAVPFANHKRKES
jgi:hypothetical protein